MASTTAEPKDIHFATNYKPVPAPRNDAREQRNAALGNQPPGSHRRWLDVWGPAIFALLVNLVALVAVAAFAVGGFSERMNSVEEDVSELEATAELIRLEIADLNENYGRVDERLESIEKSTDRLSTTVQTLNDNVIRMAADQN